MATNPMQRKARVSFILGILVTLIICGVVIGFLFWQLTNYQKKEKEDKAAQVSVYVLNQDVRSGQVITTDMYTLIATNKKFVPSNATSDLSIIENYALQDKEGNNVITKYEKGNATLYLQKDKNEYEMKAEEETNNYYIEKNGQKEYVELNSVPLVAKIDVKANTVITTDLLEKEDNRVADDVRKEEYNSFVLPIDLQTGDYIDIRLMLPSGQNYIVTSKKEVEIPSVEGVDVADTIWLNMTEDEILTVSSAIVDAYRITGAKLYVNKYTDAGMQNAATPTYVATRETSELMDRDPNILEKAKKALISRYRQMDSNSIRNDFIDKTINGIEGADENLQQKMEESIQKSQESRQKYLDSLSGAVK